MNAIYLKVRLGAGCVPHRSGNNKYFHVIEPFGELNDSSRRRRSPGETTSRSAPRPDEIPDARKADNCGRPEGLLLKLLDRGTPLRSA
jgi:hypothetical protein